MQLEEVVDKLKKAPRGQAVQYSYKAAPAPEDQWQRADAVLDCLDPSGVWLALPDGNSIIFPAQGFVYKDFIIPEPPARIPTKKTVLPPVAVPHAAAPRQREPSPARKKRPREPHDTAEPPVDSARPAEPDDMEAFLADLACDPPEPEEQMQDEAPLRNDGFSDVARELVRIAQGKQVGKHRKLTASLSVPGSIAEPWDAFYPHIWVDHLRVHGLELTKAAWRTALQEAFIGEPPRAERLVYALRSAKKAFECWLATLPAVLSQSNWELGLLVLEGAFWVWAEIHASQATLNILRTRLAADRTSGEINLSAAWEEAKKKGGLSDRPSTFRRTQFGNRGGTTAVAHQGQAFHPQQAQFQQQQHANFRGRGRGVF